MIDHDKLESLPAMLFGRIAHGGDRPFMWAKRDGAWQATTWREAGRQVRALARALRDLGIRPGDRVALVSENRPEWLVADYAIMAAGAITVPAYATNTVEENRHVMSNAGVSGVIASTRALAPAAMIA